MIDIQGVSKIFQTNEVETHALSDIDLTIYDGDYISITGPSGCGKSTLLSIMGLLDKATTGCYKIDGMSVDKLSMSELAKLRNNKIGFVFQQFNLIDELSVYDNVALPLLYSDKKYKDTLLKERVEYCLEKVGMGHRAQHRPNQLSGGQQQRVAIARALVGQPSILLVDEPTGNLDSKNGDQVMTMLSELNKQGTTIAMVTHDPRYANYALIRVELLDGKIVESTASQTQLKMGSY